MPNLSDILKLRAALTKASEQLSLPGVKAVSGVQTVEGRPGMYYVDPTKMRSSSLLNRAWDRNFEEEKLAEKLNPSGTRATGMLQGALESLQKGINRGIKPNTEDRATRGVVQVDENGNIVGAAAINPVKAQELLYPNDLDFTRQPTNYLDFISSVSPHARGVDMARALQDAYGPHMVFQVYNPEKNIPLYRKWGAKPLPKNEFGEDALGGGENLPAYEITDPIESATGGIEDNNQMRLPFADGGAVPQRSMWDRAPTEQHVPRKDKYDETIEGLKRGLVNWVPNAAGTVGDVIDALSYAAQKVGRGQSQKSVPSLGAGAASRRAIKEMMGLQQPTTETSIGSPYEPSGPETFADVVNPLMFINPSAYGRAAIGGVKGLGMLGAEAIARGIESGHPLLSMAQPMSVVKPKGGQWLSGSVENALSGLIPKAGAMGRSAVSVMDELNRTYPPESLASMSPETRASIENAFSRLVPQTAIQNWIEGPLTKYVKTRMASPEDEVRKLAEQGILHVPPGELNVNLENFLKYPLGEVRSKTPSGQSWEGASDIKIGSIPSSQYPGQSSYKLDEPRHIGEDLGFRHLIDELRNALNPESGLPRHLQLTPEAMKNLSMEKAVRRVHDINDWRAAQQVEANRQIAEKASVVREYAENNPKGLRWVELKTPEFSPQHMPDGYEIREMRNNQGGTYFSLRDKLDGGREVGAGMSPELALKNSNLKDAKRQALADQLKYEGDTMGHCVGGYCDEVLSGNSRIFSLRDAKGQPHVTIEVAPEGRASNAWVPEGEEPSALPSIVQIKGKQNRAPNPEYLPFVQDFVRNSPFGKGWADIGDLQNTGLTKHSSGKYISDAEATAMAQRHFGDVKMGNKPDDIENPWQYANRIRRYDPDMLSDTDKAFLTDWEAGNFAKGGRVRTHFTPMDLHGIIAQLEAWANA